MKTVRTYDLWKSSYLILAGGKLTKIEQTDSTRRVGNCVFSIGNVSLESIETYRKKTANVNLYKFNRALADVRRILREFELSGDDFLDLSDG